jgi:plasmid stability protein
MPRLSKYDPLKRWLRAQERTEITLTFREIEEILGFDLPESALRYDTWWANSSTGGPQIRAWRDAGWEVSRVDRSARRTTFRRVSGAPVRPVARTTATGTVIPAPPPVTAPVRAPQRPAPEVAKSESSAAVEDASAMQGAKGEGSEPVAADVTASASAAGGASPGAHPAVTLPAEIVDTRKLPPQARRLLELRAARHGRTLARELVAILEETVAAEHRLLVSELRRLREATERPGSFDLLALLGRKS